MVLHVSNFHHHKGGAVAPMQIGPSETIFFYRNLSVGVSLFIAGALLATAIISLIIFYFQRSDYTFLFFGLFALSYIYRIVGTDTYCLHQVFQGLDWFIAIRLEYLSLYLSAIFFTYFYKNLIEQRAPNWIFHVIGGVSALMAVAVLLPVESFSALIDYYLIFIAVALVATTSFYLRTIRLKHTMSWFTSIAIISLIVVMGIKMSAFFGIGSAQIFISSALYLIFIVAQTVSLSQRFGYNIREHMQKGEVAEASQKKFYEFGEPRATNSYERHIGYDRIFG